MVLKGVGQWYIRIRKANNDNLLPLKFDPSLLPKILSTSLLVVILNPKEQNLKVSCVDKTDDNTLSNSKASCQKTTSKCMAEWIDEQSEQFVCLALKSSPQMDQLKKIKYTFDLTLSSHIFDALLEHSLTTIVDYRDMPLPQSLEVITYCKLHNLFGHSTSNCNMFRQLIRSAINKG
jgi:hypothetical protein